MAHLIVLGGGPGGYSAAFEAKRRAGKDLDVTLIEKARLGGTCLNVGCIPTKTILGTAHKLQELARAEEFALKIDPSPSPMLDRLALRERKNNIVSELVGQVEERAARLGVKVIEGEGTLSSPPPNLEVTVNTQGEECVHRGDALIIATGSIPFLLPTLDAPGVWTSDDAVALDHIPSSMLIVGGGVIGVEFASAYATFGSKVTLVELTPTLLPGFDKRVCKTLARILKERGVSLHLGVSVMSLSPGSDCCSVTLDSGEVLEAEIVMSAVGRVPNTRHFGFRRSGLAFERRAIAVDEHFKTNLPHIYAIGDVIGGVMLAHAAEAEGIAAAKNALSELGLGGLDLTGKATVDASLIPACVYTMPEISTIGLSVEAARGAGFCAVSGIAKYAANGKALAEGEGEGFVQLVADAVTGRLLGAQIVGARAVELIAVIRPFLVSKATVNDITDVVFSHPTLSEIIRSAAEQTVGKLK